VVVVVTGAAFESQIGPRHPDLYSRTNTTVLLGIGAAARQPCCISIPARKKVNARGRGGFERSAESDTTGAEAKPALCVLRC